MHKTGTAPKKLNRCFFLILEHCPLFWQFNVTTQHIVNLGYMLQGSYATLSRSCTATLLRTFTLIVGVTFLCLLNWCDLWIWILISYRWTCTNSLFQRLLALCCTSILTTFFIIRASSVIITKWPLCPKTHYHFFRITKTFFYSNRGPTGQTTVPVATLCSLGTLTVTSTCIITAVRSSGPRLLCGTWAFPFFSRRLADFESIVWTAFLVSWAFTVIFAQWRCKAIWSVKPFWGALSGLLSLSWWYSQGNKTEHKPQEGGLNSIHPHLYRRYDSCNVFLECQAYKYIGGGNLCVGGGLTETRKRKNQCLSVFCTLH